MAHFLNLQSSQKYGNKYYGTLLTTSDLGKIHSYKNQFILFRDTIAKPIFLVFRWKSGIFENGLNG